MSDSHCRSAKSNAFQKYIRVQKMLTYCEHGQILAGSALDLLGLVLDYLINLSHAM